MRTLLLSMPNTAFFFQITYNELLNALDNNSDLKDIDGLSYRKNKQFIHNPWKSNMDLSNIKLPDRSVRLLNDGFHICGRKASKT